MKDPNRFYVYVIYRLDDTPCYVGKGQGSRWRRHSWKRGHKNKQLRKLLENAGGKLPTQIFLNSLTEEDAFYHEVRLIAEYGRGDFGPLVNETDGGEGQSGYSRPAELNEQVAAKLRGVPLSPERREKIRQALLGKKQTPELIALRVANRGPYTHSETTRAQISDSLRKRHPPKPPKGPDKRCGPMREEHRLKIKQTMQGMPKSEEHKANLRLAAQRRHHPELFTEGPDT